MCCACANFEEEENFTIAEDEESETPFILDPESATEEEDSSSSEESMIAGDEIEIEDLKAFEDEEQWIDFTTQIDPFDPTMDWNDIGAALDNFYY